MEEMFNTCKKIDSFEEKMIKSYNFSHILAKDNVKKKKSKLS